MIMKPPPPHPEGGGGKVGGEVGWECGVCGVASPGKGLEPGLQGPGLQGKGNFVAAGQSTTTATIQHGSSL